MLPAPKVVTVKNIVSPFPFQQKMPHHLSNGAVRRQLKADLIGKDSHRGVTLTYAWLANQFGHFGLGLLLALVLYKVFFHALEFSVTKAAVWAGIGSAVIWLLFEIVNFLGPLLRQHQPGMRSQRVGSRYPFPPAWRSIAFDTGTDVLFFWLGAFSASLFCQFTVGMLIALICVSAALVYPSRYWYRIRIYLQTAQYPFQFRLSQWNFALGEAQKKTVLQYASDREPGRHLLIYGAKGSGKTSLAVAIATERSFRQCPCTYTTGMKLYTRFFEQRPNQLPADHPLWDWWSCQTLVIDDINPGEPIEQDLVGPKDFLRFVDTYTAHPLNRETLKAASVIWVLGSETRLRESADAWTEMLREIGVAPAQIYTLRLP